MSAFDHVLVLLSFVFALALTHLLSRVGGFIVARKRVKPSGLTSLAIVNAVVMVFQNWLLLWTIRDWRNIDLLSITVIFVFSITLYFICAVAAPEAERGESIDMEEYYWDTYRPYYALVLLFMLLAFAVNFIYLKTSTPQMFVETNIGTLPSLAPSVLALAVRARWAHWASGIGLLVLNVGFTVFFAGTLS
jgi:hypothetical protein